MIQIEETPKHRKKSIKRKWVVKWIFVGNPAQYSELAKPLLTHVQKYRTEKAAQQAKLDWEEGRGHYGSMLKSDWVCQIFEL